MAKQFYVSMFVLLTALVLFQMIQSVEMARKRIPGPKSSPGAKGSVVNIPEETMNEENAEEVFEEDSIEEPESSNNSQPVRKEVIGPQI